MTLEDLKESNAQLEKDNKKLRDENRTLRIICEENDAGGANLTYVVCMYEYVCTVVLCMYVCMYVDEYIYVCVFVYG